MKTSPSAPKQSIVQAAKKATLSRWSMTPGRPFRIDDPNPSQLLSPLSPFTSVHAGSCSVTFPLCKPIPFPRLWLYHPVWHTFFTATSFRLSTPPFVSVCLGFKYVCTLHLVLICLCIRTAWHTSTAVVRLNWSGRNTSRLIFRSVHLYWKSI